jgi:hypothetical protein
VSVQQRVQIAAVLLVELDDLKLGQCELGERDRRGLEREPLVERKVVAHLELVDEDVDLAAVRIVVEEQAPGSLEPVECGVGAVSALLEERGDLRLGRLGGDEIDVLRRALEDGGDPAAAAQLDRHAPEQPGGDGAPLDLRCEAVRLLEDVGGDRNRVGRPGAHPVVKV